MDDSRPIILSLRPGFAAAIADGRKTIELRRRFPDVPRGSRVVVYVCSPLCALVGVTEVVEVRRDAPSRLWAEYSGRTAVSQRLFRSYFSGVTAGVAIRLGRYRPFSSPLSLNALRALVPGFHPPQSFRYLPPELRVRLVNGSAAAIEAADVRRGCGKDW